MLVLEQLELKCQNRIVFEKLVLSTTFKRVPKYFSENEACFLFLEKGMFQFRTPTQTLTFSEGDGMLAKCGNYYIENITPLIDEEQVISAIGAFFYPSMIKPFFENDLSLDQFQNEFDTKKINIAPLLKSFIESISFLLANPTMADENLILTKLKELLILLSKTENAPSIKSFVNSLFTPHEYEFKEIIQKNLFTNLVLSEIAFLTHYSLATFKRKFQVIYGESPAKYILKRKLEKAKLELKIESKSISDIAYDCGFETVSSFDKAFKRIHKISPSSFRSSQKEK